MSDVQTLTPAISVDAQAESRITEITVGGFKSIASKQSIEVRPLTILAGVNSSGKSTFIQALLLLKQTLDAPYDPGPLLINGPNVKFTSGEQMVPRVPGTAQGRFEVGIGVGSEGGIWVDFSYDSESGFKVDRNRFRQLGNMYDLPANLTPQGAHRLPFSADLSANRHWKVVPDRCFLRVESKSEHSNSANSPGYRFAHFITGLLHVPGLRGSFERAYPKTGTGPTFPGTFDPYVASLIELWQAAGDRDRLAKLNSQLERVGLTRSIRAKRINDAQIELHVDRLPTTSRSPADFVNIADVGFGVPTALSVLVSLVTAKVWQAVYLEQPELHLHPRAQVKLADVLADAAKRGVTLIAETHSSLLIRGIQTLVAKGELDPKLVKLHWFSRSEADGATKITSADLDENGAFGDWPMDFDEVELKSEGDYLDAVEFGRR